MKLYNTLTKQKEEFVPITPGQVKMYVCGPTVYNYIHIGNARSTVAFDVVRRYFEYRGYEVKYVSNFTDVDDKIINKAKELQLTPEEVANKFIEAFYEDTALLNVKQATLNPRVMESIDDIIVFIETLIEKNFAYVIDGDVYFRTVAFSRYGQLSGQSIDELQVGASQRVDEIEQVKKENPLDFALWKSAKANEIYWQSPWGNGRPGWHIECSVMATKHLGQTIDIHAGGQDLTFPHHENEIAQSEACTGVKFSNYWMHNGFVTFDGEKMSKSLGNFILVHDLLKQVDPQVVRFLLASAHYRHPLAFNEALIEESKNNLDKIKNAYYALNHLVEVSDDEMIEDNLLNVFEQLEQEFITEMDDDINVPNGLMVVYKMVKEINLHVARKQINKKNAKLVLSKFVDVLNIFGIMLVKDDEIVDSEILALVEERTIARQHKDFKRSDEIRDYLKSKGIILDDTPQGTRFKRV